MVLVGAAVVDEVLALVGVVDVVVVGAVAVELVVEVDVVGDVDVVDVVELVDVVAVLVLVVPEPFDFFPLPEELEGLLVDPEDFCEPGVVAGP